MFTLALAFLELTSIVEGAEQKILDCHEALQKCRKRFKKKRFDQIKLSGAMGTLKFSIHLCRGIVQALCFEDNY